MAALARPRRSLNGGASASTPIGGSELWNLVGGWQVVVTDGHAQLPEGMTRLPDQAFHGRTALVSVACPHSLVSIGRWAFLDCSSLTAISFPAGLTSLGYAAFHGCSSLASADLPAGLASISDFAFHSCASLTRVGLPTGITSIGDGAFHSCSSLASLTLPAGLTSAGGRAFFACSSLASIAFPDSLVSIGSYAFSDCYSLASVDLPDSLATIGQGAFHSCSSLTSLGLPTGRTSIGEDAFRGCSSLASVTLPAGLLTDGVPASKLRPILRALQSHACSKPFRVPVDYVALNLPHYPTIITQPMDLATVSSNFERGRYATVADLRRDIDLIWQNAIDFNGPTSWIGVLATTLREITEHEFSTSIGRNAFAGCSCLNDVSFSAGGRTSIDGGAFYGCSLTRVTVPTTAKVGGDAFPSTTTVLRLPPAKMRWYAAVGAALAYKRCRSGLLLWLERANIRLGSYGPEGAARKRDREEFECDFAPSQEQDGSCSGVQDLSREGN